METLHTKTTKLFNYVEKYKNAIWKPKDLRVEVITANTEIGTISIKFSDGSEIGYNEFLIENNIKEEDLV